MTIDAVTALVVAIAGVIGAITALVKQYQSARQLQQHVQTPAADAHPPAAPAARKPK